MSDTTKEKILKINTQGAEKNVKSLKTQIRELKEQLAGLEKGTAEYDAVAKKLADTNQKQIEINEAMRYSNKDLGATLSNLTKVSAGVVGAISSINSVMVLMGADSEEAMEAMKRIQSLMAIIQGLSSIDTAVKALKGLTVAFKDLNTVKGVNAGVTAGATTSELAEAGALADNTVKMHKNNEEAREFNRLNKDAKTDVDNSKDAIDRETKSLIENTKQTIVNKQAKEGKIEAARKSMEELEKLNEAEKKAQDTAQNEGYSLALQNYKASIDDLGERIEAQKKLVAHFTKYKLFTDEISDEKKKLKEFEDAYQANVKAFNRMIATGETELEDLTTAFYTQLDNLYDSTFVSFDEVEKSIDKCNRLIAGMPFEQAQENAKELAREVEGFVTTAEYNLSYAPDDDDYKNQKQHLEDMIKLQQYQQRTTQATIEQMQQRQVQQAKLKKQIAETIESENGETAALEANNAAKKDNAKATGDMAKAEAVANKKLAGTEPVLKKIGTGIKGIGAAIKNFVASNPILLGIAVAIGAITYALVKYTNAVKEANKERKLMADISADVNHTYEEETVRLNTLLKTVNNVYETQAERKKAYEELNKIIPEYNAHLDETTGKYVANDKALEDYLAHLREKAYLEAYEGKIKEYMQEQLELQLKINKIQNSGWNLFGWRIKRAQKEIKELDKDIDGMYRNILNLDLSKALDENNPTQSPVKTVLKTFKDIIDSIKSMYADIWNTIFNEKELKLTYNGVYRETDILLNNIERLIKSRNIQGLLSDEFKKAMSEGFTDDMSFNITLDWVFDRTQQEKFYNELEKERINLEKMMSDKTKKYTDEEIKAQQDKVNGLKAEEESRKLVIEAVQKYFVQRRKEADETERLANAQENYNHQLEVEKKYIEKQRRGDKNAEANKEIALGEYQIETIKQRIQYRQSEIDMLKSLPLQNEQVLSRIKELNAEQLEDQKKTNEELEKVDNAYYQKRLNHLEKENGLIIANSEEEQRAEEIRRMIAGGGVVDYNTDVDLINMQLKAIEKQQEKVDSYYEKEKSKYAENTDERIRLEQERLEALDRLQEEYSKKDIERQMADADRKLAIQKAYIAAYQSISSQVTNILGEVMNSYDESSKEYLRLKYAQGVTDTLSGTLAAYMSGIESGLVPPANTILAGVLAAMTFATGVAQLANIKKGSLSNAATASTVQIGNEYDTLSYAQNAEILSNIQDQRIYVTEHDITTTQRRVQVQETQATF